jgi:hypothetical protein
MPVNETLELDARLRDSLGVALDTIVVNGMYPERFSGKEAEAMRAVTAERSGDEASGRDRGSAAAAIQAALTEHERARTQRSHLRRLKRAAEVPVHTLPFLFDAEVGLAEYGTLAAKLGRDLG